MRPQSFRHQMPPGRPFNQFQGPRNNFGARPPRFAQHGMMPPPGQYGPMPGPGLAPKGTTPKLESFMDTANRFLATAQSFSPIVQQASPMFRNLPALWKLYKGFQGLPKNTDSKPSSEPKVPSWNKKGRRPERFDSYERENQYDRPRRGRERDYYKHEELSESPAYEEVPKRRNPRPSVPRIFQPDYNFDE